jgi:hypothetical protein
VNKQYGLLGKGESIFANLPTKVNELLRIPAIRNQINNLINVSGKSLSVIKNALIESYEKLLLQKRIEYLLTIEYGGVLPELKNCKWEEIEIDSDKIYYGNTRHRDNVLSKELDYYSDSQYKGIRGIVINKFGGYQVIDGYHRFLALKNSNVKTIKVYRELPKNEYTTETKEDDNDDFLGGISLDNNDTLVIYYSGHGSLVNDTNNDELSGKDSVIVPIDYKSAGYIKDDTIRIELLKATKGNVFCVFDSCNSGGKSNDIDVLEIG